MDQTVALIDSPTNNNARIMLGVMLVAAAIVVVDLVVGTRGNIGTDTSVYAGVYDALLHHAEGQSRFEPVFYYLSVVLAATGMSFTAYESVLFLVMMALPIKMVLRWLFNLKYIVHIGELFFNI